MTLPFEIFEYRLILPVLERHFQCRDEKLCVRDKGIWLFLVIILSEGNKVDILAVAQKSDIFQVHAK